MTIQSKMAFALTLAVTLATVLPGPATAQLVSAERARATLEGTWRVAVTPRNCKTGAKVLPPFQSLLTFAEGGTATETTANPLFFPSERGPGHGVWRRDGRQSYTAASIALITRNGALVETQTIEQTIEMQSADLFYSKATSEFSSPNGKHLATVCAIAVGRRYVLDR